MSQRTRYFLIGSAVVVILGLGVGAVAYYNGNLPLKSRMGPEEFSYLPADVNAVAFANVGAIMASPFTQKLRQVLPTGEEKAKIQEALGLDIERDIDSVVAGGNGAGPCREGHRAGPRPLQHRPSRSAGAAARRTGAGVQGQETHRVRRRKP